VGKRLFSSGMELSPPTNDLYAANRTKIPLIGCTTINFTVHGKEYSADLAVTDTVDELILGIDWLMKNLVQWDFGQGTVRLGNRWYKLRHRKWRLPAAQRFRQRDLPVSLTALVCIEHFAGQIFSSPSRPDGWRSSKVWPEKLVRCVRVTAEEEAGEIE